MWPFRRKLSQEEYNEILEKVKKAVREGEPVFTPNTFPFEDILEVMYKDEARRKRTRRHLAYPSLEWG